jgi:hypothetical protein
MGGGRYMNIYPDADVSGLSGSLAVSGVYWLRAEIPASLLDGSTRQVNILDGTNSVQFDIKVSVFDPPVTKTPETPEPAETPTEEVTITEPPVKLTVPPIEDSTDSSKSLTTLFGDYILVIFIGAGVLLIVLIAVIIAVCVTRGKKKKQVSSCQPSFTPQNDSYNEKSEYIGEVNAAGAQFTIKLSNPNNPSKNWTLPVSGELIIGRAEHATIRLDDKSVSREQCKIVVQGAGLVVVHLSQTNKTSLNGANVASSSPLQSGGTLKFGREVLHIDYIQSIGTPPPAREPEKTQSGGKTESIF